jgi:hypothetical protein
MRHLLIVSVAIPLLFSMSCGARECSPDVLKTEAVYLEHLGDSDKPIYPLVIALKRPNDKELRCAVPNLWMSAEVFAVSAEELEQAVKLVRQRKPSQTSTTQMRKASGGGKERFGYVLVPSPDRLETGLLDLPQSHELLGDLAAYFNHRRPELYDRLSAINRRF